MFPPEGRLACADPRTVLGALAGGELAAFRVDVRGEGHAKHLLLGECDLPLPEADLLFGFA